MTTRHRTAIYEMMGMFERFQWDMAHTATREAHVPDEWREVWQTRSSKKRKVSLYVDDDVYRIFKSMGAGMGPRMNLVLGAFVRARLAGMLEGEDILEKHREAWFGKPKPSVAEAMARYQGAKGER